MNDFTSFDTAVNSFYLAFYGRPADPAGMAYWSAQLAANNGELATITAAFATSEEAQVRFGTDSVGGRIAEIYQQLFNRTPEAAGLAYWTGVVEQGHASMADVAMAILKGAQGTDASLSVLRQQAADAFTASVDAGATEYTGYAAIDAARILLRAVTADTTAADVKLLVQAAVSFSDTASKTPEVVGAIATGSTLLGLFDTVRGKGDPVALARMLADTAKAAAGNPATLESLLRGGGVDQVLKVMPANASLQDVVNALAVGGLAAAIDVVYPSEPVTRPTPLPVPVADIKIEFLAVTQGEGDIKFDNVTRLEQPLVAFKYSGRELAAGERFEFSLDNVSWSSANIELIKESYANIVSISGIDLSNGQSLTGQPAALPALRGLDANADLATTVYLQVVNASGQAIAASKQEVVWDHYAAAPGLSARGNAASAYFDLDQVHVRSIQMVSRSGIEAGATIEYLQPAPAGSSSADEGKWSTTQPIFAEGENTIRMRQIDVSGNVSEMTEYTFTIDSVIPDTPTIALAEDTGVSAIDGITSNGKLIISGLEKSDATGWQYSIDQGKTWTFGGVNGDSDTAEFDLRDLNTDSARLLVSQVDAAGNTSVARVLNFTLEEAPAAAPSFQLTPTEAGLEILSNVAGKAQLYKTQDAYFPLTTNGVGKNVVAGTVTVEAQNAVKYGVFKFLPTDGELLADAAGATYAFGTDGGDLSHLSGQYVWGFGGNDTITGTSGNDMLFGGDGDDTITAGAGADYIVGGKGGDVIDLGSDGAADTVVIHAGDTLAGVYHGGSLQGIDIIVGAEKGDMFQLDPDVFAAGQVTRQSTYLDSDTQGKYAIVRGTVLDGAFTQDNMGGRSYIVQWNDGEAANSILLKDYGAAVPVLDIDFGTGLIILVGFEQL